MKKSNVLFLLLMLVSVARQANAQNYGNEWINYSQSYFKFGVARDDIYRIPVSQLITLGLPSGVQGDQLQLFRDGNEVAIYVSNGAALSGSDYIEFFGEKANGAVDAPLFQNPAWQMNPNQNLVSDTAFYFLTYTTGTGHKRYQPRVNTISGTPVAELYCWDKQRYTFRNDFAGGPSYYYPSTPLIYLSSSQYEEGEGPTRKITSNNDSIAYICQMPYKVAGAPAATFKTTVAGYSYITAHRLQIFANNVLMADSSFSAFGYKRFQFNVPMNLLPANNRMAYKYTPMNTVVADNIYDRFGIAFAEYRYPREFNFNNADSLYFELEPKSSDYYLEITNFKSNGVAPRLYDIGAEEYLTADMSVSGKVRFLIPASANVKRLFIHSQAAVSNPGIVSGLRVVNFVNYTQSGNQGNYIILSHPRLFDDGQGNNYVNEYKSFRSSTAGGAFNSIVVSVEDVYNEFGYGYSYSPLSIKNFLRYAYSSSNWTDKPTYVFLIGKGIDYKDYLGYSSAPAGTYPFPVVPSYGEPCSDNLFTDFNFSSKPQIPIGRLPVWTGSDVKIYLDKIKDHDAGVNNASVQISDSVLWKKNVLHIAGAKKASEQAQVLAPLERQEAQIKGIYYGANVTTIKKSTTSAVETANSAMVDTLFKQGLNLVQFFGHASSQTLDYNLDNPELMTNYKRYPVFIANGCGVGNVFILVGQKTLGEKFVLSPIGGSIAFIASDNTGLSDKLGTYSDSLYKQIAFTSFGKTLGEQIMNSVNTLKLTADPLLRQHAEQIILNGDPATAMHHFEKPDYAVEAGGVLFKQLNISTSLDSLDVDVVCYNLGKYTTDSVSLFVKRTLPNGIEETVLNKRYPGIQYTDTIHLRIAVKGSEAIGDNAIDIVLDQEGFVDEISELNNSYRRVFTIFNEDLVPVFPYDFGIVGAQNVILKGSTLNPFAESRKYILQIDTTELFNSPSLLSTSITQKGGVVKWQPALTMQDSTVYYWRTAADTSVSNPNFKWTTSSFIFLNGSQPGWNQSHYFQFAKDHYTDMKLDSATRLFNFAGVNKKLLVQNVCLYSPAPYYYSWPDYRVKLNGSTLYTDGCDPPPGYSSLQFIVLDTLSGTPWYNTQVGSDGRFLSYPPCRIGTPPASVDPFFEFSFSNSTWRKRIMDFLDSIPSGYYVMMQPRLCTGVATCGPVNKIFVKDWKSDTTLYGSGVSLYHKLYNMGFTLIDSFYKNRPMTFFMKKNQPSSVKQYMEADSTKILLSEFDFTSYLYEGQMASNRIGPAKQWNQFIRSGSGTDPGPGDTVLVDIYGVDVSNAATLLATVRGDTSLSFIDPVQYPYLKLVMHNTDNTFATPEQVKKWRVLYQLVPEAALNPNRHFVYTDSVDQGQGTRMEVAIENLTELPMDSMLVKFEMIDKDKVRKPYSLSRYRPLGALDTLIAGLDMRSGEFPGNNIFAIDVNPDNDQPEQFHPNNLGFLNYYVAPDKQNPLIDVTFDGVHIMDKDIVSARPFIQINLRDENKFMALNDTSLVGVYMRYPGESPLTEHYIPFDGTTLRFIPADLSDGKGRNLGKLEFRPTFTADGDDYLLTVKARDRAGNFTGTNDYRVSFEVINKPSISSVINYPNPFSTSTQFVFTITGAEIPSNLKIQILSPSGKVVREIVKSELGPLHVGNNITEFRWKGDDQFGQPLANGVYLYRVITNLHGNEMDHYKRSESQSADKWMEKGFGKLYIMR